MTYWELGKEAKTRGSYKPTKLKGSSLGDTARTHFKHQQQQQQTISLNPISIYFLLHTFPSNTYYFIHIPLPHTHFWSVHCFSVCFIIYIFDFLYYVIHTAMSMCTKGSKHTTRIPAHPCLLWHCSQSEESRNSLAIYPQMNG